MDGDGGRVCDRFGGAAVIQRAASKSVTDGIRDAVGVALPVVLCAWRRRSGRGGIERGGAAIGWLSGGGAVVLQSTDWRIAPGSGARGREGCAGDARSLRA